MSGRWVAAGARLAASLVVAGIAYLAWLSVFLMLMPGAAQWLEAILWLLTPVATAAGFALGMALGERWTRAPDRPRNWIALFPLVGCALGAAIVYPFGAMLIVFGMFVLGLAAMGLLEILRYVRDWRGSE